MKANQRNHTGTRMKTFSEIPNSYGRTRLLVSKKLSIVKLESQFEPADNDIKSLIETINTLNPKVLWLELSSWGDQVATSLIEKFPQAKIVLQSSTTVALQDGMRGNVYVTSNPYESFMLAMDKQVPRKLKEDDERIADEITHFAQFNIVHANAIWAEAGEVIAHKFESNPNYNPL